MTSKGSKATVAKLNKDQFIIENILEKKLEAGVWKYLVKWIGYSSESNTWEPAEHFNSEGAKATLSQFEEQWETNKNTTYTPELGLMAEPDKSAEKPDDESTSESLNYVSDENDVSFKKTKNYSDFDILEECPSNKEPECMIGAIDLDGHLTYLVEWKKEQDNLTEADKEDRNLISSTAFKLKYPQIVINFYQQHISFSSPPSDGTIADPAVQALIAASEREATDGAE